MPLASTLFDISLLTRYCLQHFVLYGTVVGCEIIILVTVKHDSFYIDCSYCAISHPSYDFNFDFNLWNFYYHT